MGYVLLLLTNFLRQSIHLNKCPILPQEKLAKSVYAIKMQHMSKYNRCCVLLYYRCRFSIETHLQCGLTSKGSPVFAKHVISIESPASTLLHHLSVYHDDSLTSYRTILRTEQLTECSEPLQKLRVRWAIKIY